MSGKKRRMRTPWVDPDDAPELTGHELKHPKGVWKINERPVTASDGKAAMSSALRGKSRINIHLDNDVIAYYKSQAGDRGYQTLINAALRRDMESEGLKEAVSQAIESAFEKHLPKPKVYSTDEILSLGIVGGLRVYKIPALQESGRISKGVGTMSRSLTQGQSNESVFNFDTKTEDMA